MRRLALLAGAVLIVLLSVGVVGASRSAGPGRARWVIEDLGTLAGKESQAVAINTRGQVVGWSLTASGATHAFLWRDGKMRDLPPVGVGVDVSEAVAVTDGGVVAGNIHPNLNDPDKQAVLWQNGKLKKLPTLGGINSWVSAVNQRGQIVGVSSDKGGETHAALWQKGKVIDLGVRPLRAYTPDGDVFGAVSDINERGEVVGWKPVVRIRSNDNYDLSERAFHWHGGRLTMFAANEAVAINERSQIVGVAGGHAVLWQNGRMTTLGGLPGRLNSDAVAINEAGQVIGTSSVNASYQAYGRRHAFVWQHGKMIDLGVLPGRTFSQAVAINERGQIAGFSCTAGEERCRAFLWERGKISDLGTLGGDASRAAAINDNGQIIGYSTTKSGQRHAVLWTLRPGS